MPALLIARPRAQPAAKGCISRTSHESATGPKARGSSCSSPGSPRGSIETRGLDSPFAHNTYVSTALEEQLLREVQRREAQLVILCGNAGDGKTAFLQNLALRLGLPSRQSAERVWESRIPDGLKVVINLDGAASYKNRSSDEMLDQFFSPFQNGPAADAQVHLWVVNDGRLLQWVRDPKHRLVRRPTSRNGSMRLYLATA